MTGIMDGGAVSRRATQHGLAGLPIYGVWSSMLQRCFNPKDESFCWYGARGITVCERWNDVALFLADMGHPPAGMTIGRIDNDGHYEPSNCRWETQEQQNSNTVRNCYVTWQGRTQTIKAWAQELDRNPRSISERLRRDWTVERALLTPTPLGYEAGRAKQIAEARQQWAKKGRVWAARSKARRTGAPLPPPPPPTQVQSRPKHGTKQIVTCGPNTMHLREWAKLVRVNQDALRKRLDRGWDMGDIIVRARLQELREHLRPRRR